MAREDGSGCQQLFTAPSIAPQGSPSARLHPLRLRAGGSVEGSKPHPRWRRTCYDAKQTQRKAEPPKLRNKLGVLTGPPPRASCGRGAMQMGALGQRNWPDTEILGKKQQLPCLTQALPSALGKWHKEDTTI